ncbi:uncharacterized protein DNG_05848 [Cephalotrichum gorgonifer]|uniref:Uncharacterized protein n=1 Tax=Cephalotrichum gorgonifer TaxID=2041049 RepID=A0AAE8SVV3_9PEZI|nr:uncharacterized protein DNG_05848 [Cephalotrichum gorgonifer]
MFARRSRGICLSVLASVILTFICIWPGILRGSGYNAPVSTEWVEHGGSSGPAKAPQLSAAVGTEVIGLVFYGRRAFVRVLDCYLKRNLRENGGVLDQVIFSVRTDDVDDLAYLDALIDTHPKYAKYVSGSGYKRYVGSWEAVKNPQAIYIKIDDDVVFVDDGAIAALTKRLEDNPQYFAVSANVVNNPALSWVHHGLGVYEPFWPESSQAPLPTPGPDMPALLRRQQGADTSYEMWTASGRTCGFLSGFPGAAFACDVSSTCAYAPSLGMRLCCNLEECEAFLQCMNAGSVADPLQCDDICQANQFLLKCSSDAPFCRTLLYPSGITDYDCVKTSSSLTASASFTYTGWANDFPLDTVTWMVTDGTTMIISGTTTSLFGGNGSILPGPTTVSDGPVPSPTPPTPTPDPSPNNTGAIVGGTVGGVAVIALVGLALFFILRKKKGSPPPPTEGSVAYPRPGQPGYASPRDSTFPQSPSEAGTYWSSPGHLSMGQDPKFPVIGQMNQVPPVGYSPVAQTGIHPQQGVYPTHQQQTGPIYEVDIGGQRN